MEALNEKAKLLEGNQKAEESLHELCQSFIIGQGSVLKIEIKS
jgi:hypothetical protein